MSLKKVYFPNLNGLRFIAAFLVIIHHTEQLKSLFGLDSYWGVIPAVYSIGKLGIILFFVLSGFLITYLLLAEEDSFKTIKLKAFYMRRVLRIWPLYFLILLLAFAIFPNTDLFRMPHMGNTELYSNLILKVVLFVMILPNVAVHAFGAVPFASHTWSIGVEEQFYLIWPVLLNIIKKNRIGLMIFIIIFHGVIRWYLESSVSDSIPYRDGIKGLWLTFNVNSMAIGGLFSVILYYKSKLLSLILNQVVFYLSLLVSLILLISSIYIPYVNIEVYSVLFGLVIVNFAANPNLSVSLENKVFNYLGNISYGLYMYHTIGIVLSIRLCQATGLVTNWIIYPLCLTFTILLAGLSYKYFERYFLKFKYKFSKILSGIHAK